MSDNTKIQWTDATWNPVRGCTMVSAGCANCYAMSVAARFSGAGQAYVGLINKTSQGPKWNGEIKLVHAALEQPLRWSKPRRIFVNSMSDLFHEAVPFEFIDKVFAVMAICTRHTFQVLTKRPARMLEYFKSRAGGRFIWAAGQQINMPRGQHKPEARWPLSNVWLGVSVENQVMADERIPLLLQTPAAVRFLSIEPLLGAIDIGLLGTVQKSICPSYTLVHEMLHWVIVGGESGPNARAMHPNWARSLRDQCAAAGVAFFFKQWGEWRSICQGDDGWWQYLYKSSRAGRDAKCTVPELGVRNDGQHVSLLSPIAWQQGKDTVHAVKVGKKAAGSLLDGKSHDAYPNEAAQ